MNIDEIRQKMAYDPKRQLSLKEMIAVWVGHLSKDYPIALTLTLNQVVSELRPNGIVIYRIKKEDCERIARRFIKKLNRQAFGNSAERYDLSMKYLVSIEGNGVDKNFHLHMAIGSIPSHIKFNQMDRLIMDAKLRCDGINQQHKTKFAGDSGWGEYICKELSNGNTDKFLWDLA